VNNERTPDPTAAAPNERAQAHAAPGTAAQAADKVTQPDCAQIAGSIARQRPHREQHTLDAAERIRRRLRSSTLDAQVTARLKSPCSAKTKMQQKSLELHGVHDLCGVRVVVDTVKDCYAALAMVHDIYPHLPELFDDYIEQPKDNGYRSLHTVVVLPCSHTLEVQIRTHEQHRHAEAGEAAHWRYKLAAHRG